MRNKIQIVCEECGRRHRWLRANVTITCECGFRIDRPEQLRQREVEMKS